MQVEVAKLSFMTSMMGRPPSLQVDPRLATPLHVTTYSLDAHLQNHPGDGDLARGLSDITFQKREERRGEEKKRKSSLKSLSLHAGAERIPTKSTFGVCAWHGQG
jgi:hypothetical protein